MRGGELETVVYLRNDRSNYFLPMLYDTFFLAKKELAWMGAWQRNRGTERGMRRTAERGGGLKRQVTASEVEKVYDGSRCVSYMQTSDALRLYTSRGTFPIFFPFFFITIANSLI